MPGTHTAAPAHTPHPHRPPVHCTPGPPAGPDLGVPSLTFQAFYEAKHGTAAWAALDKIPRQEWMAYLVRWLECMGLEGMWLECDLSACGWSAT